MLSSPTPLPSTGPQQDPVGVRSGTICSLRSVGMALLMYLICRRQRAPEFCPLPCASRRVALQVDNAVNHAEAIHEADIAKHLVVFQERQTMQQFMWQPDMLQVAKFLDAGVKKMQEIDPDAGSNI